MKRNFVPALTLRFLCVGLPGAKRAPSFEGDNNEPTISLIVPYFEPIVNLVLPADYYASNITIQVTGMPAENNASAY